MLNRIKQSFTLAGLSAGLMYLFDPAMGNRRRALIADQFNHAIHRIANGIDVALRDMENRINGAVCELRQTFVGKRTSPDETVSERVRSKLGRYSSHPAAIEVEAQNGCVTMRGPILADEVQELVSAVRSVRGVERVENQLDVHSSAENISALQGGMRPSGEPFEWLQENWSPTARLLAGLTGGMLMANCAVKRTLPAMVCGAGGFLLVLRSLSNQQFVGTQDAIARRQRTSQPTRRPAERSQVPAGSNIPRGEKVSPVTSSFAHQGLRSLDERIDEASMESFPASDAPSFMG